MPLSTGMRDRGRALAERLGASELARQAYLAELHPLCPRDGLAGTYAGLNGGDNTDTVAHLVFTCPHHDAFVYDSQTGAVWLIPAQDESSIRLEPLDRLARWQQNHASMTTSGTSSEWTHGGPPPR